MKSTKLLAVLPALFASLVIAPTAFGGVAISAGNRVVLLDSFGTTGGGEFQIYRLDDNGNPPYTSSDFTRLAVSKPGAPATLLVYNTFCIQTSEGINLASSLTGSGSEPDPDEIYKVGGVTNLAQAGADPLSAATEALFFLFATQNLQNYRFGGSNYDSPSSASNRAADADLLQQLLWFLEGEVSSLSSTIRANLDQTGSGLNKGWILDGSTSTSVTVNPALLTLAASLGLGTLYDVQALNLLEWTGTSYPSGYPNLTHDKYTKNAQDMLVVTDLTPPPGGSEPVPEPATLVVWSMLSSIGLAYGYRRRKAA